MNREAIYKLKDLGAWVVLGALAAGFIGGVLRVAVDPGGFDPFTGFTVAALSVAVALLVALVGEPGPQARTTVIFAMVVPGLWILLGLSAMVMDLVSGGAVVLVLGSVLSSLAAFALLGAAVWVNLTVFRALPAAAKPQPGYGFPPSGGYPAPFPGEGQQGQFPQQPQSGQFAQQGQFGQPQSGQFPQQGQFEQQGQFGQQPAHPSTGAQQSFAADSGGYGSAAPQQPGYGGQSGYGEQQQSYGASGPQPGYGGADDSPTARDPYGQPGYGQSQQSAPGQQPPVSSAGEQAAQEAVQYGWYGQSQLPDAPAAGGGDVDATQRWNPDNPAHAPAAPSYGGSGGPEHATQQWSPGQGRQPGGGSPSGGYGSHADDAYNSGGSYGSVSGSSPAGSEPSGGYQSPAPGGDYLQSGYGSTGSGPQPSYGDDQGRGSSTGGSSYGYGGDSYGGSSYGQSDSGQQGGAAAGDPGMAYDGSRGYADSQSYGGYDTGGGRNGGESASQLNPGQPGHGEPSAPAGGQYGTPGYSYEGQQGYDPYYQQGKGQSGRSGRDGGDDAPADDDRR
ncbi:hypothetical protein [Allonocardiopsis opalescens]|uniref:hypothetical protein n=1 Tax=Allonocardiopsis opalescens TaxID=1144618 RepID=UPI000D07D584|nr:hypothetical protein [Allonocardiopsis opalescens]